MIFTKNNKFYRFTGVTGTERAFQILNSGVCFPSQPFPQATIRIIELLRDLAPTRSYYPKYLRVMETIKWPSYISPLAAHDNFVYVTDILVSQSNRLAFLFAGAKDIALKDRDVDLGRKATRRRALISNGVDEINPSAYELHIPLSADFTYSREGVEQSIQISHLSQFTPTALPEFEVFNLFTDLLLRKAYLNAGFDKIDLCSRTIYDWMSVDFTNSWLGIYEAARKVRQSGEQYDWIMFLSYLAFRQDNRVSVNQLAVLNAIAAHCERFDSINKSTTIFILLRHVTA